MIDEYCSSEEWIYLYDPEPPEKISNLIISCRNGFLKEICLNRFGIYPKNKAEVKMLKICGFKQSFGKYIKTTKKQESVEPDDLPF